MIKSILYVLGGEKASGAEIVIERLISNNNFQSHLLIAPGDFSESLIKNNKPYSITVVNRLKKLNRSSSSAFVFYFKALYNYFAISYRVYKYIKKHKIDAVHCNTIGQASYLLPLVALSPLLCPKVKWIWTDHDLKYYFFLDNFLSVLCSKFYDITFVVSNAVKQRYRPGKKIVVLYNGLNSQVFKPDKLLRENYRAKLKLSDKDIVIGCAGVISLRKGQLELIKAFNILRESYSNIYLILAGRFGGDELTYNEEVRKIINSPGVTYVGQIEDMVSFYNGCDVVISNSDLRGSEPLGTTIYEAMACEKIVLGSDTGGTKEIIDNNVDGYLFEADNSTALMSALEIIINSIHNHKAVEKAARKKVMEKFDINIMAANYRNYILN